MSATLVVTMSVLQKWFLAFPNWFFAGSLCFPDKKGEPGEGTVLPSHSEEIQLQGQTLKMPLFQPN